MRLNQIDKSKILGWIFRLTSAAIMGQTLFFKFTSAPESIYIFTKVGMEPSGRYIIACLELIASILLLIPNFSWLGSFMAAAIMIGAIFSHLTLLGVEVLGDGRQLFALSVIVLAGSLGNLFLVRARIPWVGELLTTSLSAEDP